MKTTTAKQPKGTISHQGYTITCLCGAHEVLLARTLKDAKQEAEGLGWYEYARTGWNCPPCDRKD